MHEKNGKRKKKTKQKIKLKCTHILRIKIIIHTHRHIQCEKDKNHILSNSEKKIVFSILLIEHLFTKEKSITYYLTMQMDGEKLVCEKKNMM